MSDFILVCSDNYKILSELHNQKIIIDTYSYENIPELVENVLINNSIFCIYLKTDELLSKIPFDEKYKHIPIALKVKNMGDFKEIIEKYDLIKDSNLKIFFSLNDIENSKNIQILSSLGIFTGIDLENYLDTDWDLVNDLMHFFIYTHPLVKHAPIEPFEYLVRHYKPAEYLYFKTPYFENPHKFLFIDNDFNIALKKEDLKNKNFLGNGLCDLLNIKQNLNYEQKINESNNHFLNNTICSTCPSWRICQGSFFNSCSINECCYQFFSDLIDALDFYYSRNEKAKKWQI